ncbi:ORF6N domain-containing protein [Serratia fonticola]|nr:ORF6N domain-containing protein [Serratia fonticola]
MPVIIHSGIPVVTSEQLSRFYNTEVNNIKKNYSRNASRFQDGKHYFLITGSKLKELKNSVTFGNLVDKRTPKLTLWTERGAARHAKMLETDQAWDVYEALEDCYFNQKEKAAEVAKTKSRHSTATQLTPLRQTAERLITTGLGRLYPDIWKLVHQRFDIEHIHQLQPEQIGEAIEYLNTLEGEFLGKQEALPAPAKNQLTDEELCTLCWLWNHATFMIGRIAEIEPLLRVAEHRLAGAYYSMSHEYVSNTNSARRILEKATAHIAYEVPKDDDWYVLNRLRINHPALIR